MIRITSALVLLVCGGLTLAACGNKEKEGEGTSASASAAASAAPVATTTATATATAAETASAPPAESAAPSAAPSANPVALPPKPIDDCCRSLSSISHSGRAKDAKRKAAQAAKICNGIARLVREGKTTRQSALTQVRSALVGVDAPAECQQ